MSGSFAPPSNHASQVTNVHGLPANVAPLGDRSSSGRFIQSGSGVSITTASTVGAVYTNSQTISFPVAFSSTPLVIPAGAQNGQGLHAAVISSTGFTMVAVSGSPSVNVTSINWIALGT